jgi:calcineurin-like phosphoesterase family protein
MRLRHPLACITIFCLALAAMAVKSNAQENQSKRAGHTAAKTSTAPQEAAPATPVWTFAVSGDSRNCGDVVMPAIAADVKKDGARFYWHLGDFRAVYNFDEDIQHQTTRIAKPLNIIGYEELSWNDFIQNQLLPFGTLPVFLAIGNHEIIPPKTREQYLLQFADWIDTPALRKQRLNDDGEDFKLRTYYHWIEDSVDFITLDNATPDQFDSDQLTWFEKVLIADSAIPQIRSIVVGMHKPLPESISKAHSMNESIVGTENGRRAYADLLSAQNGAHKHVYVLASHSHYFMDGIFDTEYWRNHGGVLPGWIVGTAGAQRYAFPENYPPQPSWQSDVYGYLLGTVKPDGQMDFAFQQITQTDVPATVASRYSPDFVYWCFAQNSATH